MSGGQARSAPPELRTLFTGAWHSLPAMLTGSVVVIVAAVLVVLVSPGVNPVSALLAGVLVGPAFAVVVAAADRLWLGEDVPVRALLAGSGRCWRPGVRAGLVPAIPAALFLVAHEMWAQSQASWLLVPMSISAAVTVVATLVTAVALPVSLRDSGTPAPQRWLLAAHAVARQPVPALAVVAVVVLGVWSCVTVAASLAILVPGPVALTAVAAARTLDDPSSAQR